MRLAIARRERDRAREKDGGSSEDLQRLEAGGVLYPVYYDGGSVWELKKETTATLDGVVWLFIIPAKKRLGPTILLNE